MQALQEECLGFQLPSISLNHNLHWYSQSEVMGTSIRSIETLGWGVAGTPHFSREISTANISLLIFNGQRQVWNQPVLLLCPPYSLKMAFQYAL